MSSERRDLTVPERRAAPRWFGAFPARIRGIDAAGQPFEATTLVDNISPGGLYAQVARAPMMGARFFSVVSLPNSVRIAAKGRVVRVEARPEGLWGIGVALRASRSLRPPPVSGDVPSD